MLHPAHMPQSSKGDGQEQTTWAGVCGTFFIQHCIHLDCMYFNFKNRLWERRKNQKLAKGRGDLSKSPDLGAAEAIQKFFLEEEMVW